MAKKIFTGGQHRIKAVLRAGKPAHRFGWKPDLPDHRDREFLYSKRIAPRPPTLPLPPIVSLRGMCSPVEDQGDMSACTGNALVGHLEFLEEKAKCPFVDLSRLFIYYNERSIEHTVTVDCGAAIRDGIKTLVKQGVCEEKQWPYTMSKLKAKPSPSCYKAALGHRITSYHRIITLNDMLECLAEGYPFVFGFTAYESFESDEVAKTGVLGMPVDGEPVVGGHAVMAVGYTLATRTFYVRNSWGTEWGQAGYFTMPFEYLDNTHLADDMWTIRR